MVRLWLLSRATLRARTPSSTSQLPGGSDVRWEDHFDLIGATYDLIQVASEAPALAWKVGQVIGPVLVGTTMDIVSTEAGFLLAVGFVFVATTGFALSVRRAYSGHAVAGDPIGE